MPSNLFFLYLNCFFGDSAYSHEFAKDNTRCRKQDDMIARSFARIIILLIFKEEIMKNETCHYLWYI